MDTTNCELLLNQTLQTTPSLVNNIGQLMTRAWADQKSVCTKSFGSVSKVSDYVTAYQQGLIKTSGSSQAITTAKPSSYQTLTVTSPQESSVNTFDVI